MAKITDINPFKTHSLAADTTSVVSGPKTDEPVMKHALNMQGGQKQADEIPKNTIPLSSSKPKRKRKSDKKQPENIITPSVSDSNTPKQIAEGEVMETSEPVADEDWAVHKIQNNAGLITEELNKRILKHLAKLKLLDDKQIKTVQKTIDKEGLNLTDAILKNNFLKENEIGQALASFFGRTYISFKGRSVKPETLLLIPKTVSQESGIVAFDESDGVIKIAMVNPEDLHLIHLVEKKANKIADVHYTTSKQINEAIKSYPSEFQTRFDVLMLKAGDNITHLDTLHNISDVFDSLVLLAYQRGASDVHIEPFKDEIRVRFRVDGVLNSIATLPIDFLETVINHIKVLSKLRIDIHNASQDGRFHITYDNTTINFRVSIMPTHYGEKSVLRLLTSETQEWSLTELGYHEHDRKLIEKGISRTTGMILCCGPTGSGKTTTLYALLKELNYEGVNISTIEDPIEYGLPGIMQTQVNPNTNITYAEGLKSLMRQDPDILMIGEIRDFETGKIAVNSALTGHLVLSTLHTNNASLAPLRMLQMDIDSYLIVNTVNLIIAQRLVRKICDHCRSSYTLTQKEFADLGNQFGLQPEQLCLISGGTEKISDKLRLFKGLGCKECGKTGFQGRSIIAEVLEIQENIRELILKKASESEIQKAAQKNGMVTMLEDGLYKVKEGVTTLEEVFRVINQ